MTTRADGRGGSTPPRPAAPGSAPGQWFVFKPRVYDAASARKPGCAGPAACGGSLPGTGARAPPSRR